MLDLEILKAKATFLNQLRSFFQLHGYLEVDTPLVSAYPCLEENIDSIPCQPFIHSQDYYLATSPEYHMKSLLSWHFVPIFQLCKAFRRAEQGRWHNSEFMIAEWYRPHWDLAQLLAESLELFRQFLPVTKSRQLSFRTVFTEHLKIDPYESDYHQLKDFALSQGLNLSTLNEQSTADATTDEQIAPLLDLLFACLIQPHLGQDEVLFLTDFPLRLSPLSVANDDGLTARRFEAFYQGIELINACEELLAADQLRHRLETVNANRAKQGKTTYPLADYLFDDLKKMQKNNSAQKVCSGAALGVDRLFMLHLGLNSIREVLAFPLA
jgi:lysyl-tRNA synthetase class 2